MNGWALNEIESGRSPNGAKWRGLSGEAKTTAAKFEALATYRRAVRSQGHAAALDAGYGIKNDNSEGVEMMLRDLGILVG